MAVGFKKLEASFIMKNLGTFKESTYTRKQMDDCHRLRVAQRNDYEYYYQCGLQSLNLTSPMKSLHQIEIKLYLIFSFVQVTQEW